MDGRIRAVAGGTSASKTISVLVWLIDYCQCSERKLATVVSESYPHLVDGAMRDFKDIMKDREYWEDNNWHDTKHEYTFESGSILQFKSIDTYGKAHGPRRDVLFINECNYLDYKIADQLISRTREIVWLDWNPTNEFWFYTEMQPHRDDVDFITLTYKDNEALDAITIKEIESHKHNKNWWQVYGLGQLGDVEGRIYTGWTIIDDIPAEARLERRGLDFGYSVDPDALIDVYKLNKALILDERLYRKGMSNKLLADFINLLDEPETVIYADSASPKDIDELAEYGINIAASFKGPGSVNTGIRYLQDQHIYMTKRSVNLIKEYRNYMWEFDKDGRQLAKPMDIDNHLLDALRYACETYYINDRNSGLITPKRMTLELPKTLVYGKHDGVIESAGLDIRKILSNNDTRTWKDI